jgi:hypothetical protein
MKKKYCGFIEVIGNSLNTRNLEPVGIEFLRSAIFSTQKTGFLKTVAIFKIKLK